VLRRVLRARPLLALLVGVAGVATALWTRRALGVEWSVDSLRDLVSGLGLLGLAAFVLLIGLRTPLLLPSQLVLTAAGACFGVARGTLVGAAGMLLSASIAFALARWLGAEQLARRVPSRLRHSLELAGSRAGAGLLCLATGYPFGPTTLYHATAALTPIRYAWFALAVGSGAAIRAFVFSYFGSSLMGARWLQAGLAGGALLLALLPWLHPGVRRWARRQLELDPTELDPARATQEPPGDGR